MVQFPERTRCASARLPPVSHGSLLLIANRGGVTRFFRLFLCRALLDRRLTRFPRPPRTARAQARSASVAVPVSDPAECEGKSAVSYRTASFRPGVLVILATLAFSAVVTTAVSAASRSPSVTLSQADVFSNDRCIVYTYFEDQGMGHEATVDTWQNIWRANGWKPVVLSEDHARLHPDYESMKARFSGFPTTNPEGYEVACYLRYLAMAVVGGGFMSDYDVANVNVPPPPRCDWLPNEGRMTSHEDYTPAVLSGSGEEYDRVARLFYDTDIELVMASDDTKMVSDMLFLEYFRDTGAIWTTHALFTFANWVSDPPCDDAGVELPMLFHFSYSNTHYELGAEDKPSAMNAFVSALNETRHKCSPLPRESDAEYEASYFAPPGTNAFREAHFKHRQCFLETMYPQPDCAETDAPAFELLLNARDADGNPATVRKRGGHKKSDTWAKHVNASASTCVTNGCKGGTV
jgi:hypothetical protein